MQGIQVNPAVKFQIPVLKMVDHTFKNKTKMYLLCLSIGSHFWPM